MMPKKREIIAEHLAVIRQEVWRWVARLPSDLGSFTPREDLFSVACVAYLDLMRRYRGRSGTVTRQLVRQRVCGAIIDELRSHDFLSRRARWKLRDPDTADFSAPYFQEFEEVACVVPLHSREAEEETAVDLVFALEVAACLAEALRCLDPREEQIVRRHFFDGIKLFDIGVELGISEPRVCQLLARALTALRPIYESIAKAGQSLRRQANVGGEVEATELQELGQIETDLDALINRER